MLLEPDSLLYHMQLPYTSPRNRKRKIILPLSRKNYFFLQMKREKKYEFKINHLIYFRAFLLKLQLFEDNKLLTKLSWIPQVSFWFLSHCSKESRPTGKLTEGPSDFTITWEGWQMKIRSRTTRFPLPTGSVVPKWLRWMSLRSCNGNAVVCRKCFCSPSLPYLAKLRITNWKQRWFTWGILLTSKPIAQTK